MIALKNILVATDFSEPACAALRHGMELARRFGASLHVLHVVSDLAAVPATAPGLVDAGVMQATLEKDARADLDALIAPPDRAALNAHLEISVSAWPGRAILQYAREEQVDLIVLGTHGRTGLAHWFLGSVAEYVSRRAHCPVLTVRFNAREFVTPDALQKVETAGPALH